MDLNLKGKKALIAGGSKGIGRGCGEVLASEGCSLMLAARDRPALLGVKDSIVTIDGGFVSV